MCGKPTSDNDRWSQKTHPVTAYELRAPRLGPARPRREALMAHIAVRRHVHPEGELAMPQIPLPETPRASATRPAGWHARAAPKSAEPDLCLAGAKVELAGGDPSLSVIVVDELLHIPQAAARAIVTHPRFVEGEADYADVARRKGLDHLPIGFPVVVASVPVVDGADARIGRQCLFKPIHLAPLRHDRRTGDQSNCDND